MQLSHEEIVFLASSSGFCRAKSDDGIAVRSGGLAGCSNNGALHYTALQYAAMYGTASVVYRR